MLRRWQTWPNGGCLSARTAGDGSALPVPAWDADLHFFDPADPEMSAFYILLLDTLNFSFWPDFCRSALGGTVRRSDC